ncbi:MAG TPA: DUF1800 domain-containing protein, partial [Blastocatellia bacterium]|nr:DUF1800 domain-containing protein [Blastocatellia bacterium]
MTAMTVDDAAHLLRRMGLGSSPIEINKLPRKTRALAVDSLLNFGVIDNSALENRLAKNFNPKRFTPNDDLQMWWIVRMVLTARPFEEKMTFFWHNHFATSLTKVPYPLMYIQNLTLRASCLDRFDSLLLKVSQDPAMLVWLDGVTSSAGAPNENYGRELQELFTMGTHDIVTGEPNYTEQDVKEIARAFTGWRFTMKDGKHPRTIFSIDPGEHDNGVKTIYGQQANFTGEDVVTIISAKRATARFLVNKLFKFFVYPLDATNTTDQATIEKFADVYFSTDHSIKELLRAIFTSDEFFSQRARFALVKSPAEFVAGTIRMLATSYNPGNLDNGDFELNDEFRRIGLDLLNPFDVSGWKLNLGWLNTSTVLERYNFANALMSNRDFSKGAIGARVSSNT